MTSSELLLRTQNLVRQRPYTKKYKHLAEELSEYGVTVQWLKDFVGGRLPNAPAYRVEALYNHLSAVPLLSVE